MCGVCVVCGLWSVCGVFIARVCVVFAWCLCVWCLCVVSVRGFRVCGVLLFKFKVKITTNIFKSDWSCRTKHENLKKIEIKKLLSIDGSMSPRSKLVVKLKSLILNVQMFVRPFLGPTPVSKNNSIYKKQKINIPHTNTMHTHTQYTHYTHKPKTNTNIRCGCGCGGCVCVFGLSVWFLCVCCVWYGDFFKIRLFSQKKIED